MRTQLFDITHTTTYHYESPVTVAHHLLRLAPRRLPRQFRLAHELNLQPAAASLNRHTDYFGNEVAFVIFEGAHRQLRVTARSRVAVGAAFIPDAAETPAWESVRGLCRTDLSAPVLAASEFTFGSPLVPLDTPFTDYARDSFPTGRAILDAVLDLTARIHRDFEFDATATTVATPLARVLEQRRGVCQDFAHLQIACLRSLGLPARYVSGYLETVPPPGQPKLVGADASHAWVSIWCGPAFGWLGLDPTNAIAEGDDHIVVARGRDYADVPPVDGVILSYGGHELKVSVDVAPVENAA